MAAKKKRFNWGTWIVLLLIVGGAAGGWAWYKNQSKEQPIQLKTVQVNRGDIVQAVTANGALSPVKNVQVGSQVSGIIQDIFVDFNSHVTNKQVIAIIDPSTYEQNITSAKAELANAQAGLEYAQLNYNRAKELRTAELISSSDYDKTLADLHQGEAVVQTRLASLKRAQVDLERTTIVAPVDGIVISRNVDVGQTVAASFSTPTLFQIANDLRNMRIEAMVSEADVGGVEESQRVTFTVDAFPGRQFRGEVSQVRFAPITNQNVVSYTTVVDVNNADLKLRPGMTATASVITGEKKDVLRVPNAALRFRPPEDLLPKSAKTNASSGSAGTNAMAQAGSRGSSGGGEGGERPNREEMRRRFENMSPEEREQMRQRFRERGGGGGTGSFGGGSAGGGGGGRRPEGPVTRTIYVMDKTASKPGKPMLKPVTVKTGIADNSFTEIMEGLSENDEIVTGLNTPTIAAGSQTPQGRSPFGGGGFGGGGGMRGPR
jgi:HlyD family secretion protein